MRISSRLLVAMLTSAAVATLLAIAVNIVTSESVPPPFDVLKPYAIPLMIGLWLVTALLMAADASPRHRAEELDAFLAEPQQVSRAVSALRGRLEQASRRRVAEQGLFHGFPELPQEWREPGGNPCRADGPAKFVTAFEAVRSRRLVILGPGGIGKSTWLHNYAVEALARDHPDRGVPLLLEVSQWPRRWDFARWVEHHLTQLFPVLATRTRGRQRRRGDTNLVTALLHGNRFVLLLDGFDEVAPARRGELLSALNDTLWLDQAVIMTSRREAYLDADMRLRAAATLVIEPLSPNGVEAWLNEVFPTDCERWQPVIRALHTPGSPVAEALSTPLMVTLAARVYESPRTDPGELVTHSDAESARRHLLGQYIPVVYDRGALWTAGRARGWLEFLATRLGHDNAGIAWWRMHTFVPRWLFAILFGAAVGVCVGVVAAYGAAVTSGAVPADPLPYQTGDFFAAPHLVLTSWLENSVRSLAGGAEPSATVTAVVAGSAFGAVCSILIGGAVGAVSGAATGLVVVFGDGTSDPFLLAVRVGMTIGAGTGLVAAAYDGSASRWGHPSPDAPATVDLRKAFRRPRRIVLTLVAGFVAGAGLALIVGRQPALFGALGAAVAFLLLFLLPAVNGLLEDDTATSGALWTAEKAERPQVVLRNDIVSSAVRVAAAAIIATPIMVLPDTQWGARPGLVAAMFFVLFTVARELWLRPWSWWLVAVAALAARNRLPWRAMAFLEDARERQVLRREGGVYRFRSFELQTGLANLPLTPTAPPLEHVTEQYVPPGGEHRDHLTEAQRWRDAGDLAGALSQLDAAVPTPAHRNRSARPATTTPARCGSSTSNR